MATHSTFGERTEATEVAAAFAQNIRGKTVLITGVSPNGLGIATALAIASQHPRLLILAGRSLPNLHQAISSLSSSSPSVPTEALELDLASPDSIRAAASELLGWEDPAAQAIDVLINNAGVMSLDPSRVLTQAGLELHFATNHLGHFLFANLIMRKLLASAERGEGSARVVNVASNAHLASPIRYHDVNLERAATELPEEERPILQWLKIFGVVGAEADGIEGAYDPFVAYAQSKTASVLFSVALAERMRGKGVRAFSLNPGAIITNLQRTTDPEAVERSQTLMYWKTQGQGSATQVVAAFDPALDEHSGAYLENCQVVDPAPFAADKENARRLWEMSERLVGEEFA